LEFDKHLFVRAEPGATSTLELDAEEVKNENDTGFDIPLHLAKMLREYRDHIAPKHIGHRPKRLFVNLDGTPKSQATVAYLIKSYALRRAGIVISFDTWPQRICSTRIQEISTASRRYWGTRVAKRRKSTPASIPEERLVTTSL
jgi:hypothetical protein